MSTLRMVAVFGVGVMSVAQARPVSAQSPAHTHMRHVAEAFRGTPEGQGLLPTAIAEAEVAATHAGLMVRDLTDLAAMKRHAGHVLHAIDPGEVENGPGLGYGVKPAAAGVARHISLAAGSEGASDNIGTHAPHIATAATNTVTRADRIIELARAIQEAESAEDAAGMAEELSALAAILASGVDADENGRIGWQEGEGGLDAAQTHLGLMQRGESGG